MKKITKLSNLLFLGFIFINNLSAQTVNLEDLEITKHSRIFEKNNQWWYWDYENNMNDLPLVSSDEGDTWNTITPNITLFNFSKTGFFNGTFYSIGGYNGNNQTRTNQVDYSTDGINWATYNAPFSGRRQHAVFTHNNKLYVVGGESSGSTSFKDVWYTVDGLNWTQATNSITNNVSTFYTPLVASVNNKIIVFGGQESEFGGKNDDKVYVSDDDGQTFTGHLFPFNTSLGDDAKFFVYNNKLWVHQFIARYHSNPVAGQITLTEGRFFTTTDGVNWNQESEINTTAGAEYFFTDIANGKVHKFKEEGGSVERTIFEETTIVVPEINSFINNQNQTNINIQFPISGTNGNLTYCITSSNNSILAPNDIHIDNGNLTITPNTLTGQTQISIEVSDNTNTEYVDFWFFNMPGEQVAMSQINNRLYTQGSNPSRILLEFDQLDGYGTNNYNFTSSDNSFINETEMSVSVLPILNFEFLGLGSTFSTNNSGESQLSVTATDGTYSSTSTFWVKVGDDLAPIANGTLIDYAFNNNPFSYQLPTTAFTEPEGQEMTYSSHNLPCGLSINPLTGEITGIIDFQDDFMINIIATDRYSNTAMHSLTVTNTSLSINDNSLLENELVIYPNPSRNYFNIKSTQIVNRVLLYNVSGRLIRKLELNITKPKIQHQLSSGIYFVQILLNNNTTVTKKLIINP